MVGHGKVQKLRVYTTRNVVLYPDRCGSNVTFTKTTIVPRAILAYMRSAMNAGELHRNIQAATLLSQLVDRHAL